MPQHDQSLVLRIVNDLQNCQCRSTTRSGLYNDLLPINCKPNSRKRPSSNFPANLILSLLEDIADFYWMISTRTRVLDPFFRHVINWLESPLRFV